MKQIELKIEGMMCGHCQSHVAKSFTSVEGVKDVTVDLENATAQISFDENNTNADLIKAALNDTNYIIK